MNKKRLLVWSDFLVPTGFGNVAENLLDTMHEDYEVFILGINYRGDKHYDTSKYFVYPTDGQDLLGIHKLPVVLDDVKPDIIFLFQDIFHISDIIEKIRQKVGDECKIVSYFPVDGSPFNQSWSNVLDYSDAVVTYSDWAIEVVKNSLSELYQNIVIEKLYHGVNQDIFFKHSKIEIEKLRRADSWENKFVVCNVNRFQPRKFIAGTSLAFSMFAKGYAYCTKCGHHMPINRKMCDLNSCSGKYLTYHPANKEDVFLYLHMMPHEHVMGPGGANALQSHLLNAGYEDSDVNKIVGINARNIYKEKIPPKLVNNIYNASNLNISSAIGEGCGLSLIEAASSGTPSIAPRNSAIPEMLKDTGHLIDNAGVFNMALDNGHLRPIVDPWKMTEALEVEYQRWKNYLGEKEIRQKCIDNIQTNFLWDDKVSKLKNIFKGVFND